MLGLHSVQLLGDFSLNDQEQASLGYLTATIIEALAVIKDRRLFFCIYNHFFFFEEICYIFQGIFRVRLHSSIHNPLSSIEVTAISD